MSEKNLIIIRYETVEQGEAAWKGLDEVRHGAYNHINDSAMLEKDASGKIHVHNEVDRGVKVGAGMGSGLGILLGLLFGGPVGGLLVGAAAGALMGKLAHLGIDHKTIKQVGEDLPESSSALFILSRPDSRELVMATIARYHGHVYQTTMPAEAEKELKEYIHDE